MEHYLDEALLQLAESDYYPYHMPGHKRQRMGAWIPEAIDITEIDGFDNLHHAEGMIKEGQERLARVFGAEESFFLVNGSTSGLLTAICASVKKGDRVLVSRNCHKAVYHAAYLMELRVEYLFPEPTLFGIQGSIDPEQVHRKLEQYPDVAAVVITSPTYDGVVSDVAAIAEIVHAAGIPLIVDEAHGAHFGFSQGFPQKAIALGADFCIESVHKTLPAYTQSAVLHICHNDRVNRERVKRYLGIFQSSSPSYVLMAGIDRCVRILQNRAPELFDTFEKRMEEFYENCRGLRQIEVAFPDAGDAGIWKRDGSKILMSGERIGLNGQQLYDVLRERYHLQMEMASGHYCTAIMSIMDTEEGFDRLWNALRELDRNGAAYRGKIPSRLTPVEIYRPMQIAMRISDAVDGPKEEIPLEASAGRVSGEFVYLYPPGIPILAPGELVTEQILQTIAICKERGMNVEGMQDMKAESLLVCRAV